MGRYEADMREGGSGGGGGGGGSSIVAAAAVWCAARNQSEGKASRAAQPSQPRA